MINKKQILSATLVSIASEAVTISVWAGMLRIFEGAVAEVANLSLNYSYWQIFATIFSYVVIARIVVSPLKQGGKQL